MNTVTGVVCLLVSVLTLQTAESCFPAKYWITCLIDTCKLGGRCPGEPGAQCRMERIAECKGCKAIWYKTIDSKPTNIRADCSLKQNLNLCPGGETVVHCEIDSCKWPCSHKAFRQAKCRQTYCGKCGAEYFVQGKWQDCPTTTTGVPAEVLPIDSVIQPGLRRACTFVPCSIEICLGEACPVFPKAVCRPDGCNKCQPSWFNENRAVDCFTGQYLESAISPIVGQGPLQASQRQCSGGEPLVPCSGRVCDGQICRNYPNAVCSADGCGKCQATWYDNDQLVDCLSDVCPPGVPYVKCVDDPCKYFSHYCPMAECRASTCGSCEAKFFQNGQEIDCAQPPTECPADVEPLFCPWHSCPANVCPSNSRLMCRINPCGETCAHEWIDVFNGEIRTCRVFSGSKKSRSSKRSKKNKETIFFKDPMLSMFNPKQDKVTVLSSRKPQKPMTEPHQLQEVKPSIVKSHGSFSGPVITGEVLALLEQLADPAMSVSSQFITDALTDHLFNQPSGGVGGSVGTFPTFDGNDKAKIGNIVTGIGDMAPPKRRMNPQMVDIHNNMDHVGPTMVKKSPFQPATHDGLLKPIVKSKMMESRARAVVGQKPMMNPTISVKKAGKPVALTGASIQRKVQEVSHPKIIPVKSLNPFKGVNNKHKSKIALGHELPIKSMSIKPMQSEKPLYPELQPFMDGSPDKIHHTVKVVKDSAAPLPIKLATGVVKRIRSVPISIDIFNQWGEQ